MRSDVAGGSDWGSVNGSGLVPPASSSPHQRRPRLPELALLEAVVKDAARCIQDPQRGLSRQQFMEAYEWIASERRDWAFSFLNVCDLLGVDASAMRRRLGVTDEYAGSASQKDRLWLKRASMRLGHVRRAPCAPRLERGDRLTGRSRQGVTAAARTMNTGRRKE